MALGSMALAITIDNIPVNKSVTLDALRALVAEYTECAPDDLVLNMLGAAGKQSSCTVTFPSDELAERAVEEMHRIRFKGKTLTVTRGCDEAALLWVGDLHPSVDDRKFLEAFKQHGARKAWVAKWAFGKHSGRSKGYGFAEFARSSEAMNMISTHNDVGFVINSVRPVRMKLADEWFDEQARPDLECPPPMLKAHQAGHFLSLHNVHHDQAVAWEKAVERQAKIEAQVRRAWRAESALLWQRLHRKQDVDLRVLQQLEHSTFGVVQDGPPRAAMGGPPRKKARVAR